jgi:hypothetical protein
VLFPRMMEDDADCAIDTSSEAGPSERKSLPRRPSVGISELTVVAAMPKSITIPVQQVTKIEPSPPARDQPGSWTVHVSLLPSRQQTSPFEKDTTAYKRCLSRGLHRMVAIEGFEGAAFVTAVSRAFKDVLQGEAWEPLQLQARKTDTHPGILSLGPFGAGVRKESYTVDFLRKQCATCDGVGRPESLYIAPRTGKLSWAFLKQLPVHLEGLESSWSHDKLLDGQDSPDEDGSDALMLPPGSLTASPASSLKRSISEISLSTRSSASSAPSQEYVSPRSKMARTCMSEIIELPQGISTTL